MSKDINQNVENEFYLLEALAHTPETTQADLAARVGVAVGTVNWYLKRWSQKGYVKVRRIGRWQWSYLLTPEGMARKARLASQYLEASLGLYRRTRAEARRLLHEVHATGGSQIVLQGQGEIAEICRLTCLEMNIEIIEPLDVGALGVGPLDAGQDSDATGVHAQQVDHAHAVPVLTIDGIQIELAWPEPR